MHAEANRVFIVMSGAQRHQASKCATEPQRRRQDNRFWHQCFCGQHPGSGMPAYMALCAVCMTFKHAVLCAQIS